MPKFEVKWKESRTINCYAEVVADNAEAAIKRAQGYGIDEEQGEYLSENESHTDEIHPGKAKELKDE